LDFFDLAGDVWEGPNDGLGEGLGEGLGDGRGDGLGDFLIGVLAVAGDR
jgi:hypothetical protein